MRYTLSYFVVLLGYLLLVYSRDIDFEYLDDAMPNFIDNQNNNILKSLITDNDYDDDDDDKSESEHYNNYERYGYGDFKRDLIRGPSFIPTIDNDSAASELMKEENDIENEADDEPKKIFERNTNGKTAIENTSEVSGETGKNIPENILSSDSLASSFKKDILDENNNVAQNTTKKHKVLTQAEKALVSESLINLLYDWKKHNTPKTAKNKRIYSEFTSANDLENTYTPEKLETITTNIYASPLVDQQNKPEDETSASTESASTIHSGVEDENTFKKNKDYANLNEEILPSSQENTANAVSQEKERFNVLVNVNINERAARRSDVDKYSQISVSGSRRSNVDHTNKSFPLQYSSSGNDLLPIRTTNFQDKSHGTKTAHKVFGELKKITKSIKTKTEDEEDSVSGLDNSGFSGEMPNKTLSNSAEIKTVKSSVKKVIPKKELEEEADEEEKDASKDEADNYSGSGEKEVDDDVVKKLSHFKKTKVIGGKTPQKVKSTHKVDGISNQPIKPLYKKKDSSKHASDEEKESLKGETTTDTVIANKVAADRESKDNNLEQNDVKTSKKKTKEDFNDLNKLNTASSGEIKEVVDDVKFAKANISEAEDVRIEQVKSPAPLKAIPLEAAIGANQPAAKMPSEVKEESENEEIMFTKKEREEELKKLEKNTEKLKSLEKKKPESEKIEMKKTEPDDKYETLAEVREKFKKWENKIENKNIEIAENPDEIEKEKPEKVAGKAENFELVTQDKSPDAETIKAAENEAKKNVEEISNVKTKDKSELVATDLKNEIKNSVKEIPKTVSPSVTVNKNVSQQKNEIVENKDIESQTVIPIGESILKIVPDQVVAKTNSVVPIVQSYQSWKDEKKVILKKLRNPFSEENKNVHKLEEDDDNVEDDDEKEQKIKNMVEADQVPKISKKERARFLAGINRLKEKELLKKQNQKNEENNNNNNSDKVISTSVIENESNHSAHEAGPIEKVGTIQDKDSLKKLIASQVADDLKNDTASVMNIKANSQSLKQLQHFKNQILSEVEKINRLEAEYGVEDHSTRDLDEAKDVLKKDLKVVKELEKTLLKKTKAKEIPKVKSFSKNPDIHQEIYYQPTSVMEAQQLQAAAIKEQEKASVAKEQEKAHDKQTALELKQKVETDEFKSSTKEVLEEEEDAEVIPEAKLGFELSNEDEEEKEDDDKSFEDKNESKKNRKNRKKKHSKSQSKKKTNKSLKNHHHHHPLAELHSLLKAEIRRLRLPNRGRNDPQLSNIRQLVQQRLKSMLENGDLDKAAVHNLTPDIKELGMLLKKRIQSEKKRKMHKNKKNKKKKTSTYFLKESEMKAHKNFNKMRKPSTEENVLNKEISSLQNNIAAINKPANIHEMANLHHTTSSVPSLTVHLAHNTTISSQSNQMKNLLTTLNRKLGEIYAKASGVRPNPPHTVQAYSVAQPHALPISSPKHLGSQHLNTNNYTITSFQKPSYKEPLPKPIVIPTTFVQTPIDNLAQSLTHNSHYNHPAIKGHIYPQQAELPPALPQEPDFDETDFNPQRPLADNEPVDTLVENLERDITEVWSYRNMFPDAEALGLDNDKVHNTYANLGSLSGLNLRRALNRALRGEDVGLAVVGGSISKGGPFSEKGLDFVLRSYFYAIEDYWNKIIRPVTGSSMIIRDVSIGGIATDYYSYCLHNHLPNDKLTNIVLWELSANDMRRYDDNQRPKPQPLEQFTRNVLSYRAKPALVFLNFFALFEWDPDLSAHCRNFEDEGEDDIAKYYKITSLSWRNMVCPLLASGTNPLFTKSKLFAEDNFHPSILAHAQMSYIVIDYIRTEFLKNLVKMRNTNIADAVTRLQIPRTIYIPRPIFPQTYTWKPLCHTYMLVDNRSPNNTLPLDEENDGSFRYSIVREFKIRSDKIVGMDTQQKDQYIRYKIHIPRHSDGSMIPYKRLGIMSFTDDRSAFAQFDGEPPKELQTKKKFLEGTVIKYLAENVVPGEHLMTIRSGNNGFLICAIVLG
ncbi:axoneme-associated protein mst101(2) isoform X1 [Hydra vulgaris]|uniref:axoneme-associated protein mst101(2) isoform X1 n=1 Tax=Hydra vulgaris TaxID=6087 RepID=UPI001F5EB602|nr:axoneme-associated protein mst101(2) isoform X1 [Hydra vulgaris]